MDTSSTVLVTTGPPLVLIACMISCALCLRWRRRYAFPARPPSPILFVDMPMSVPVEVQIPVPVYAHITTPTPVVGANGMPPPYNPYMYGSQSQQTY